MRDIKTIEKRIEELNQQKKELVLKQAELLYNKLYKLLGDQFTPELAFAVLSDSWEKADHKQKESWQSLASTFRPKRNDRSQQKAQKNTPTSTSVTAEKK